MSSTELLIKCLALTQSDNDGEALTAIRKANIIRDKMGQTWEGLVSTTSPQGYNKSGTNTYYEQPQRNQWTHPEPDFDYDGYFLFIYRHNTPTGKWAEIIGSIKSQWEANGHLSDKQC